MRYKWEGGSFYFILIFVIMQVCVILYIIFCNSVSTLKLDRVVILSRHHVRSPLSKNLNRMTPFLWPEFRENPGFLTEKGFMLEKYMGKYFHTWLNLKGILTKDCPSENDLYVYANFVQRTMYSAKAFISAFQNCNITIHHTQKEDLIFVPYIHNSSIAFKNIALAEMESVLKQLNLRQPYAYLENILDYKNSTFCKVDNKCDMNKDVNAVSIAVGKKPKLTGPLKICNEAVDAFLMAYYNGFDLKHVAWGKLNHTERWDPILKLTNSYHNVIYNPSHVAKDIAHPLLLYLRKVLLGNHNKVTLVMGHDANIIVLLKAMSFKPYSLKNSFVSTPVGGKIVFQKWYDETNNKYLLKINYVYQSTKQIRDGAKLSLEHPPQFEMLELENCVTDNKGFCLWDDFVKLLNDL